MYIHIDIDHKDIPQSSANRGWITATEAPHRGSPSAPGAQNPSPASSPARKARTRRSWWRCFLHGDVGEGLYDYGESMNNIWMIYGLYVDYMWIIYRYTGWWIESL